MDTRYCFAAHRKYEGFGRGHPQETVPELAVEPRRENTDFWCDVALACVGWLYLTFAYAIVALQITHVRSLCPFALVTGFPVSVVRYDPIHRKAASRAFRRLFA